MVQKRLIALFFVLIVFIQLISANVLDTSSTPSYSIYTGTTNRYNISARNTNILEGVNITQINITFPSGFTIDASTIGTSVTGEFVLNGQTLSWTNNSDDYHLILNGTTRHFWVNATAGSAGNYNIIVTSLDTLSNTNSSNVPVTIMAVPDTTLPSINFTSPTPEDNAVLNQQNIYVRISASDNVAIATVRIFLYDSSFILVEMQSGSSSTLSRNFTFLDNGIYYINATVNDTSGNVAWTERRRINLSYVPPCFENWVCTEWGECRGYSQTRTCTDMNNCNRACTDDALCGTTQYCCVQRWDCTEWAPPKCPKNETQARICVDTNSCNNETGMPLENRTCEFEPDLVGFYLVLGTISSLIITGIIFLILLLKDKKEIEE